MTDNHTQNRWLPSFRSLSEEQLQIVNDPLDGSSLVYGPAGSGKTALTLYRAKVLQERGRSFRIFVYTHGLLRFIEAAAADLSIPDGVIQSFYSWVYQTHQELIGRPPFGRRQEVFDRWVGNLLAWERQHPGSLPRYDYVLVDEAQDFNAGVAGLLHRVSGHLFITGDTSQSLYQEWGGMESLAEVWDPLDRGRHLVRNYRNPRTVAELAARFLTDAPLSRTLFLESVQGREFEKKPVWYQVQSFTEQVDRIVRIASDLRGSFRIGVLLRRRAQVKRFAKALEEQGVRVQRAYGRDNRYDFRDGGVLTLTTYHTAKGLEFDCVILPDLNQRMWDDRDGEGSLRRLFFVGITRTKRELYLISEKGLENRFLREIQSENPDLLQIPGREFTPTMETYGDEDLPF